MSVASLIRLIDMSVIDRLKMYGGGALLVTLPLSMLCGCKELTEFDVDKKIPEQRAAKQH